MDINQLHDEAPINILLFPGHLTDDHFVRFLVHCKNALHEGGLIVIKDNVAQIGVELDAQDSSVTRSEEKFHAIFNCAGLTIVKQQQQTRFPAELYQVKMVALE